LPAAYEIPHPPMLLTSPPDWSLLCPEGVGGLRHRLEREGKMTAVTRIAALVAAGALLAQPCAASELRDPASGMQRQSSAFAGLNLRLPLGQSGKAKPTARLQFTTAHTFREGRTGATQTRPC
jgi:hypothetical protein